MVIQNMKKHLRHVLLWLFDKDNLIKNREAAREIQEVYGNGAITEQGCGKWLRKFRSGDKDVDDLEDEPRSGRPSNLNEEELKLLVEWDPKATVREEELRKSIQDWIASKPAGFWVKGIVDLPRRWAKVIEYEGDYFPDD